MPNYIVIGAGSAGCVVANRLSADPKVRVLLLEAGHEGKGFWYRVPIGLGKLVDTPSACWMYETEESETFGNRRISWPRGKSLGGSSAINGMLYVRGLAYDYDLWRQLGNRGWSYEDVLPFFRKSQTQARGGDKFNGSDGPLTVSDVEVRDPLSSAMVEAVKNNGIPFNPDYNGKTQEGVGYYQQTTKNGQRASTANAFLDPIRKRKNLTIEINALTTKLIFDGKRASGVAYRQGKTDRQASALREVIVSAGAINPPQILQLSGIGPGALLHSLGIPVIHDAPAVGENLQDHYQVSMINGLKDNLGANLALGSPPRMLFTGLNYLLRRKGWMTFAAGQVAIFTKSRPELELPDLQFHYVPYSTSAIGKKVHSAPAFTLTVYQQRPESRGTIMIKSPDPTVAPQIIPNYLATQLDLDTTLAGFKLGRLFCATDPIANLVTKEWAPGKKATTDDEVITSMRNYGSTAYHPTSTCRMGPGDTAVVDDELRVKGVSNLRVADASIMPNMISGNTNAASIMIGEKAADLIRAPWHQDLPYLPAKGEHLAVMWTCLDTVTKQDSLEFVRGSHRGPLYNPTAFNPDDASANLFDGEQWPQLPDIDAAREEFPIVSWAIKPGDVVVFHPATLHGGAPTREGIRRRTLSLRFFGEDVWCAERPHDGMADVDGLKHDAGGRHPLKKMALAPTGTRFRHPDFPRLRPL